MGKKAHPKSLRLAIHEPWLSQWFSRLNRGNAARYRENLQEDWKIRSYLDKALKNAAVVKIQIKRSPQQVNIVIYTARPGLVIGKSGRDIDLLKKNLNKILKRNVSLKIDIEEVRNPESQAELVAQSIAEQIERRFPYRRAMKKALDKVTLNKEIKGIKIRVAGRLNGAEIARTEWLSKGKIPLQSLEANIDYSYRIAKTIYGCIGVKVWIYKERQE